MDLMLMSNSSAPGQPMFAHVADELTEFVAGHRVLFVPYALADHDVYTSRVARSLDPYGIEVIGLHLAPDPVAAVEAADIVFVGGGNSFRLLRTLQDLDLVPAIRSAASAGTRYIGSSAGTNMAGPSLRTTNDMPIVQPRSFEALGLVPFQINPHYLDPDPSSRHMGETREERLIQFLEENDVPVLGLREGSWVRVSGAVATLGGDRRARLFDRGGLPRELAAGSDLSSLLRRTPVFDAPTQP
ncbi:MAG: dipeptidase PepE [Streptosporangiales bacterium]|nr:dipeptidase PepE [Streptosporangiales bacterium]